MVSTSRAEKHKIVQKLDLILIFPTDYTEEIHIPPL